MAFDFENFGKEGVVVTPTVGSATPTPKASGFDFASFGSPSTSGVTPVRPGGLNAADQASAETYNAWFPSKQGDTGLTAGLKAAGNLIPSAVGFAKGIGSALLNPIDTLTGLGKVAVGGAQKLIPGQQAQEENFNQFASFLKDRYGSLENLQRTATNDPFGFGTEILTLMEGGAGLVDAARKTTGKALATTAAKEGFENFSNTGLNVMPKVGQGSAQTALNKGLSTTAGLVTKPVSSVVGGAKNLVSKTTGFGVSQATGLNPETIRNIIAKPGEFTSEALKTTTREDVAGSVKSAIDKRVSDLRSTGAGYEQIRQLPNIVEIKPVMTEVNGVTKPLSPVESVLEKYKIKLVDGKVKTTADSIPLSPTDKTALEDFISTYGNEKQLSTNAYLNTRSALSDLSKYDATKTGNLQKISRDLRGVYDALGKEQIPGLKELDATYGPEKSILRQISKDYLTKDGGFKDGAVNKIANLTGVGKEQVLGRLEKIIPGVGQRVKILKAAEDIERASGLKVGTYARAALGGGALMTGNVPGIIAAIIASPEIAVKLLKAYGYTKQTVRPIIELLYKTGNDVNNFRLPGNFTEYIQEYISNPKLGNYIDDVSESTAYLDLPEGSNVASMANKPSGVPTTAYRTKINPVIPRSVKAFEPQINALVDEMAKTNAGGAKLFTNDVKTRISRELENFIRNQADSDGGLTPDDFFEMKRNELNKTVKVPSKPKEPSIIVKAIDPDSESLYRSRNIDYKNALKESEKNVKKPLTKVEEIAARNKIRNEIRDEVSKLVAKDLSEADRLVETKAFNKVINNKEKILSDYKAKYGKIVNADNFRPFFKDEGYNGANAAAVQEPSSYLAKQAYTRSLKENPQKYVIGTGGGSGTGKSSALKGLKEYKDLTGKASTILDSNLSSLKSAVSKINEAIKAGKEFIEFHVYRDPIDSFVNGVVKRMKSNPDEMGRLVPTKVIADNHIKSLDVARTLEKNGVKVYYIDNSLGLGKQKVVTGDQIAAKANYKSVEELTKQLNAKAKELRDAGEITAEQYENYIK